MSNNIKIKVHEKQLNEAPMMDVSDDELAVINDIRAKKRPQKISGLKDRLAKRKTSLNDAETAKKQALLDDMKVAVANLKPYYSDAVDILAFNQELEDSGLVGDYKKITGISEISPDRGGDNSSYYPTVVISGKQYPTTHFFYHRHSGNTDDIRFGYNNLSLVLKNNKVYLCCGDNPSEMYELSNANIDKLLPNIDWKSTSHYGGSDYVVDLTDKFGGISTGIIVSHIASMCDQFAKRIQNRTKAMGEYLDYVDNKK